MAHFKLGMTNSLSMVQTYSKFDDVELLVITMINKVR